MDDQITSVDAEIYANTMEFKFQSLTDLRRPPVVATLRLLESSVLPTKLFFYLNSQTIPPLVKILPHEYLGRSFSKLFNYMADSEKDTQTSFERGFSAALEESIELARTQDYGMQLSVQPKNSEPVDVSGFYDVSIFEFMNERKIRLKDHPTEFPYLGIDLNVEFWLKKTSNSQTHRDFFREHKYNLLRSFIKKRKYG